MSNPFRNRRLPTRRALRDKVVEEAREAADSSDDDLLTELAAVEYVMDALIRAHMAHTWYRPKAEAAAS
jgi:hypothetical protein